MLWKVFLATFSVSAGSFLVWAMVTSRLASDPQPEQQPQPVLHKRYLQVKTVQTRNTTLFHRTGLTRTTKALQREFRSMTIYLYEDVDIDNAYLQSVFICQVPSSRSS